MYKNVEITSTRCFKTYFYSLIEARFGKFVFPFFFYRENRKGKVEKCQQTKRRGQIPEKSRDTGSGVETFCRLSISSNFNFVKKSLVKMKTSPIYSLSCLSLVILISTYFLDLVVGEGTCTKTSSCICTFTDGSTVDLNPIANSDGTAR